MKKAKNKQTRSEVFFLFVKTTMLFWSWTWNLKNSKWARNKLQNPQRTKTTKFELNNILIANCFILNKIWRLPYLLLYLTSAFQSYFSFFQTGIVGWSLSRVFDRAGIRTQFYFVKSKKKTMENLRFPKSFLILKNK